MKAAMGKGFLIAIYDPLDGVTFLAFNKRLGKIFGPLDNRSEAAAFPDLQTAQAFAKQVRPAFVGNVVVEPVSAKH